MKKLKKFQNMSERELKVFFLRKVRGLIYQQKDYHRFDGFSKKELYSFYKNNYINEFKGNMFDEFRANPYKFIQDNFRSFLSFVEKGHLRWYYEGLELRTKANG